MSRALETASRLGGIPTQLWQSIWKGSAETLALKPKAKSLVLGGREYSRKRSSLWETANAGWSFLNILSSGKRIRNF